MAESYLVKVKDGKARLYDTKGYFKRSFGVDHDPAAVSGVVVGDMVHVTNVEGNVRIYELKTGMFKKQI